VDLEASFAALNSSGAISRTKLCLNKKICWLILLSFAYTKRKTHKWYEIGTESGHSVLTHDRFVSSFFKIDREKLGYLNGTFHHLLAWEEVVQRPKKSASKPKSTVS